MLDIIIFAIIALFVGYKLYKTLGDTKYDNELSDSNKKAFDQFKEIILKDAEVVNDSNNSINTSTTEMDLSENDRKVLDKLRLSQPSFSADKFLKGAKNAFETIIKAYSDQDEDILKNLVSEQIFKKFKNDIDSLKANSQKQNITVVGIQSIKIISITDNNANVEIQVEFESEQISNIIDVVSNQLISGSYTAVVKRIDRWTFVKKIDSKSNVWILSNNEN